MSGFPTGFNWILELDMFYPLPFEPRVYTQAKDLLFGKNKVKQSVFFYLFTPYDQIFALLKPQIKSMVPIWIEPTKYDTT